jgi:hypothetical protein
MDDGVEAGATGDEGSLESPRVDLVQDALMQKTTAVVAVRGVSARSDSSSPHQAVRISYSQLSLAGRAWAMGALYGCHVCIITGDG